MCDMRRNGKSEPRWAVGPDLAGFLVGARPVNYLQLVP